MKYLIIFSTVVFLFQGCSKHDLQDDENNDIDTLTQYIEFSINDTLIKITESDSISFSPHWSFESKDKDTNYVFHISSRIQKSYTLGDYKKYNSYFLVFYKKIHDSQTDFYSPYDENTKLLKPGVFDSLFSTGKFSYLKQNCFDSISNNLYIGMIFPSFERYQKNYLTHFHGCDRIDNNVFYNQDNSTFNIEEIQSYYHKKHRECLLVTGSFRANLYPDPVPLDSNFIQIENGKFKILISEPDNAQYY